MPAIEDRSLVIPQKTPLFGRPDRLNMVTSATEELECCQIEISPRKDDLTLSMIEVCLLTAPVYTLITDLFQQTGVIATTTQVQTLNPTPTRITLAHVVVEITAPNAFHPNALRHLSTATRTSSPATTTAAK